MFLLSIEKLKFILAIITCCYLDRKKDLVKLAHGEYVSLGKVEAALKQSSYVENCCAYGDSRETFIILLVVPVEAALNELADKLGLSGSLAELCDNKEIVGKVLLDVQNAGKTGT